MRYTAADQKREEKQELLARENIQKVEKAAKKKDLYEALTEALECTKCKHQITMESMAADIKTGAYFTKEWPPCFLDQSNMDENISPLTVDMEDREPIWWRMMTRAQSQKYLGFVENNLNLAQKNNPGIDDELALLWAHYQVDFHIRQHHLSRHGVLTLCRDNKDMQDLRMWQWDMAEIDAVASDNPAKAWPTGNRKTGWPNDDNLEMAHQTRKWRGDWRKRGKRVEDSYAKWAAILEERRRQREKLEEEERRRLHHLRNLTLEQKEMAKAMAKAKAKERAKKLAEAKELAKFRLWLYCAGDLKEVRDLDRESSESPVPTEERALSSPFC